MNTGNGQYRPVCGLTDREIYSWFKTPQEQVLSKDLSVPGGQRTEIKGEGRRKTDRKKGKGTKAGEKRQGRRGICPGVGQRTASG